VPLIIGAAPEKRALFQVKKPQFGWVFTPLLATHADDICHQSMGQEPLARVPRG
jgi:hypothetical protein